jgi:hypothetical protein
VANVFGTAVLRRRDASCAHDGQVRDVRGREQSRRRDLAFTLVSVQGERDHALDDLVVVLRTRQVSDLPQHLVHVLGAEVFLESGGDLSLELRERELGTEHHPLAARVVHFLRAIERHVAGHENVVSTIRLVVQRVPGLRAQHRL